MSLQRIFILIVAVLVSSFSSSVFAQPASGAKAPPFFEILPNPVLTGLIHLPSVLVTAANTVVIFAQSRLSKGDSDPSDLVLTRSADEGKTWSSPQKIFASEKTGQIGYSCVLVEDTTTSPHTLLAYYTVAPTPWKPAQLVWYGKRSTDEGVTWSAAFAVTNDGLPDSKPSNGGHGFQFPNGRLVLPGRGNLLYSDDHGLSWKTSGKAETAETKVLPLVKPDGTPMNAVYEISRRSTKYRIYGDGGEKLIEEGDHGNEFLTLGRNPGLARYSSKSEGLSNLLLMTGIHDMKNRVFSITYSTDEGRSWSQRKTIDQLAWYSDIGVTKNKLIIAAYNVGFSADLRVARFNLSWLMQRSTP